MSIDIFLQKAYILKGFMINNNTYQFYFMFTMEGFNTTFHQHLQIWVNGNCCKHR